MTHDSISAWHGAVIPGAALRASGGVFQACRPSSPVDRVGCGVTGPDHGPDNRGGRKQPQSDRFDAASTTANTGGDAGDRRGGGEPPAFPGVPPCQEDALLLELRRWAVNEMTRPHLRGGPS